jgi:hypothetical protein
MLEWTRPRGVRIGRLTRRVQLHAHPSADTQVLSEHVTAQVRPALPGRQLQPLVRQTRALRRSRSEARRPLALAWVAAIEGVAPTRISDEHAQAGVQ